MTDIIELKESLELVNSYQRLAREYGLHARKVAVPQPGGEPKEFLVFSLSKIKDDVNPVAIINRNARNKNIFYPESYAVETNSANPLLIWQGISSYLAYAEFIYELYDQFDTPLPKAIRVDELEALASFYSNATNPRFDAETKMDYWKGLKDFFKDENPKNKFKKEWQAFYRSELFDSEKSLAQNLVAFWKRHEPEVSMEYLLESSGDLRKVYMSEHHYKAFREAIKEQYPDVKYSVSDKRVVNKGVIIDPKTKKPIETSYGQTITEEQYDRIIEERFDEDGHACLEGLAPSYFEGRDVFYKATDENIIASVSHGLTYSWTKCPDLETLRQGGPLNSVEIPVGHFLNFYAGMKEAGIPIYIDTDVNSQPTFDTLRIVYNASNDRTVRNILVGLTMAQLSLAHISLNNQDVQFDIDSEKVDTLIEQAKLRALEAPQEGAVKGLEM